jgi:hypothetical protein
MSIGSHTFDHELKIDSTTKKLNIVTGDGGSPMYSVVEEVPKYEQLIKFITNDWKGGHGQFRQGAPDVYYDGQSIDTTLDGKVILGPLIHPVAESLNALDSTPTHMVWFSAISKFIISTSSKLLWYDGTNFVELVGLTGITDLVEFNGILYIAMGASTKYYYTADCVTFTQTDLTDGYAVKFFVSPNAAGTANVLWKTKTPNEISSTTDGRTVAGGGSQWTSPTYCGDTSNNITNIFRVNDLLMVGRTDNLYNVDYDGGVHALRDDLKQSRTTQNFKYVTEFQTAVYHSETTGVSEISSYNTYDSVSPLNTDDIGKVGTCVGLTSDKDNLYVAMDEGTNTIIYKGREIKRGDVLRWEWCPFIYLGANACGEIRVVQHSATDRRLWFGYGLYAGYCILSDNPMADSNYKFCPSGWIRFSYYYGTNQYWDKLFQTIVTETHNCSANITVQPKYRVDTETSMTNLTAAIATNGNVHTNLTTTLACKRIQFELDMTTNNSAISPEIKYFEARGCERPEIVRIHDVTYSVGDTPTKRSETIRSFLRTGRTSTNLIRFADLRYGGTTGGTAGTDFVYCVMEPNYPQEVDIIHEKTRQPEMGIKCRFIEINLATSTIAADAISLPAGIANQMLYYTGTTWATITPSGVMALLSGNAGASFSLNSQKIISLAEPTNAQDAATKNYVDTLSPNRSVTLAVAASNSSALSIAQADYACDGTDDDVQIQLAINSLPTAGGRVILMEGTFNITNAITILKNNVDIEGQGEGSTIVKTTVGTIDGFTVGTGVTAVTSISIRNLRIDTTVTKTAGSAVNFNKVADVRLENFYINAHFIGITIWGTIVWVKNGYITETVATTGVSILITGGNDHYLQSVCADTSGTQPLAGIKITGSLATWIMGCSFIHQGTGLLLQPATGSLEFIFASDSGWDLSSSHGINISPAAGATVKSCTFVNCWTGGSGDYGVNMGGAGTIDGTRFIGHRALTNVKYGMVISTGINTFIQDCDIAGNDSGDTGAYHGIFVGTGISQFTIQNNRIGQSSGCGNTQVYNIVVNDATSNNFVITGNDLRNFKTGAILNNAGRSATKIVRNNLGDTTDIDDAPVDGTTWSPISSNWAYDHVAAADPHTGYVLESLYNAQSYLAATVDNTPVVIEVPVQNVLGRLTGGNLSYIGIGITNDTIVQMDSADAASGEYAKFTANGLESRSVAEVKSDLSLNLVENTAHSTDAHTMTIDGVDVSAHAASATAHGLVAATDPSDAAQRHVMEVINGATAWSVQDLFDATAPAALAAAATAGTSLLAAHRDHVHLDPAIAHAALTATHGAAFIAGVTSGTYTGDNTAARAIAHGLGRVPKFVFIINQSTGATFYTETVSYGSGAAIASWGTTSAAIAMTAFSTTNFYVGDNPASANGANMNTISYGWTAFG